MSLREEITELVRRIEQDTSQADAYLAIFQYGDEPDEGFIKANEEGLRLLAAALLRASVEVDDLIADDLENIIPLTEVDEWWYDGDIFFDYIEPTSQKAPAISHQPYTGTWQDKALQIGCLTVFVSLVVWAIIGFWTTLKWVF